MDKVQMEPKRIKSHVAIEISVVMPCLNEAETLETCILKAQKSFREHNLKGEIIIADNGSTDGSQDIARSNGATVIPVEAKGYGGALTGGITSAHGRYIIMGDADDSYDFGNIFPFVEKLREGYDLVMGCRLPVGEGKIMPGAMPFKHRYLGNPVLSFIGRLFFKSPVTDFHCGLRGFTKEAFERMNVHTTGMEFASELVMKATLLKMLITEVPITLYKDGRTRPPHLRSWRDGWRHLRFMLLYAPNWLFLAPGVLLLAVGTVLFIPLALNPIHIGSVTLDTNTLLVSMLAILLGIQLVVFFFFIKIFSISSGLLPPSPGLEKLLSHLHLETGMVAGLVVFLIGLGLLVFSVINWGLADFGTLSYPESLRKVIPAVTMIVIGTQIIFSSFFMGVLRLRKN